MPYAVRASLYSSAANEARWAGYVYANLSPGRYLRWVKREPAEKEGDNCVDCTALATGGRWRAGVYAAQELASMAAFPGSGRLACTTRCHCDLVDVARPKGKLHGSPAKAWGTLAQKGAIRGELERHRPRHRLRRVKRRMALAT